MQSSLVYLFSKVQSMMSAFTTALCQQVRCRLYIHPLNKCLASTTNEFMKQIYSQAISQKALYSHCGAFFITGWSIFYWSEDYNQYCGSSSQYG
jgi:hypothetical protein